MPSAGPGPRAGHAAWRCGTEGARRPSSPHGARVSLPRRPPPRTSRLARSTPRVSCGGPRCADAPRATTDSSLL